MVRRVARVVRLRGFDFSGILRRVHSPQLTDQAILHGVQLPCVVHVASRHASQLPVPVPVGLLTAESAHALIVIFADQEVGKPFAFSLRIDNVRNMLVRNGIIEYSLAAIKTYKTEEESFLK